jgi:murein DD-endopeptidase MepM/ murein hydrolase activator NlpD
MPITIQCPVSGIWKLQTPRGHHPYSKDFTALDFRLRNLSPGTRLRYLLRSLDVSTLPSWDQPVMAPVSGRILTVAQDHDDRVALNLVADWISQRIIAPRKGNDDMGHYLGNHVIMAADDGHHLLFAHLKKCSAKVVAGQRVAAGELLAKVGNSGISMRPHLHFHITNPAAEHPDQPIPFVFTAYQAQDNGVWRDYQALLPVDNKPFKTLGNYSTSSSHKQ